MTNLLTTLPDFETSAYTHILPSLEKAGISAADLLTLQAFDVAKRAQVPPAEVRKLGEALLEGLRTGLQPARLERSDGGATETGGGGALPRTALISTLDTGLDAVLNGGIASGDLTEIVGESAAGKTQFLLTLVLSAQLPAPQGLGKTALYISTEAPLQTSRLSQILAHHPKLKDLPPDERPTLNGVQSTHVHDLEAQDHILRYQVPVAIKRHNVGLLVVDSIAANYRPEYDKGKVRKTATESFLKRSNQVTQLGALLRDLARTHGIAVVVANQVSDRFEVLREPASQVNISQRTNGSRPVSPPSGTTTTTADSTTPTPAAVQLTTDDPLSLDHQQCFFTGWGDDPHVTNLKTPSLGLAWTNQLGTRIALLKEPVVETKAYRSGEEPNVSGWKREMKVVFSSRVRAGEVPFEIVQGGVRAVVVRDVEG